LQSRLDTDDGTRWIRRQIYLWADLLIENFDMDRSASIRADLQRELFDQQHSSTEPNVDVPETWGDIYQILVNYLMADLSSYLRTVHGWEEEPTTEWLESFKALFLSLTKACRALYEDAVANLFLLRDGKLGFSTFEGPQTDCVVALLGGFDAPAVLRPLGEPGHYELLNFAWVTGAMHEDVWDDAGCDESEIILV